MRNNKIKSIIFLTIMLCTFSCQKEEDRAIESLIGDWKITTITTQYGEYDDLGRFESDSSSTAIGQLGTFNFMEVDVSYNFSNNDKVFNNISQWNLNYDRVKEGFTGKDQYTLTIKDQFIFDVRFGDQTSDSEKNATSATFEETLKNTVGLDTLMTLTLEKQ